MSVRKLMAAELSEPETESTPKNEYERPGPASKHRVQHGSATYGGGIQPLRVRVMVYTYTYKYQGADPKRLPTIQPKFKNASEYPGAVSNTTN